MFFRVNLSGCLWSNKKSQFKIVVSQNQSLKLRSTQIRTPVLWILDSSKGSSKDFAIIFWDLRENRSSLTCFHLLDIRNNEDLQHSKILILGIIGIACVAFGYARREDIWSPGLQPLVNDRLITDKVTFEGRGFLFETLSVAIMFVPFLCYAILVIPIKNHVKTNSKIPDFSNWINKVLCSWFDRVAFWDFYINLFQPSLLLYFNAY